MDSAKKQILIVEDDAFVAATLVLHLEHNGFDAAVEADGACAVERVLKEQPDGVILDGNLPGKDGFDICRELRRNYHGTIIMLTARDDTFNQMLGLELGADDYLVKPVDPYVVLAHLKACLRRTSSISADTKELNYGTFRINSTTRVAYLGAKELSLTTAEFDLLWLLASHAGTILSRDEIMTSARGIEHDGLDRSIDMRISRLRKLLDDNADNPHRIKTVRGQGYLFSRADWD
jgi:DNA-binding response OmpR family regulator